MFWFSHALINITEIFFLNIIFISQKFYWTILNVLSWNLNTFYKTQRKSMFCFYLFSFYLFFSSSLCVLTVSTFCTFSLSVNIQDGSVFFLLVISQSPYVITLSTFCHWIGSLKRTPTWTFYVIYIYSMSIFLVNLTFS